MRYNTPYQKDLRLRWYRLVEAEHRPVGDVCKLFGIPKKTYYKWYARDHGYGSNDHHPRKVDAKLKLTHEVKLYIEETKRRTNYGPKKMRWALLRKFGITASTTIIYRFYKRRGLIRRPQRKLGWHAPLKEPLVITRPGEGVQLDAKYIYPHGGRKYQFTVLDPFTEKCFAEIYLTRESKNAACAIEHAATYFGFPVISVQTDNGSEFRGDFHGWCEANHIPHFFIPKKSPYWNGKVERVHRTVDEEFYQNPLRIWRTLGEWLTYYNTERLHETLGGITPQEKVDQVIHIVTP